jgi:hypothetical protein
MSGLIFTAVVIVAAATWIVRGMRVRAARNRVRSGPGTSLAQAIPVRSFDEIDRTLARRRCHCGTDLRLTGEGARSVAERRYRLARLACDECEEETVLYFDVSEALH